MGLLFSLRGDSLTPRYAMGGKQYSPYVAAVNLATLPAIITASSISAVNAKGTSLIDVHLTNSDERALKYVAGRNWVSGTNVFTVRYSFIPNWSGTLAFDKPLFVIGTNVNNFSGGLRVYVYDNGKINLAMRTGDGVNSDMLSAATTASAVTVTNKQKIEIQVACDGTRVYLSIDGVAAGDWPLTVTDRYMNGVLAGNIYLGTYAIDTYIDEFLIFDTFEPQVYTPSASYYTCDDLDGTVSTGAGAANIRQGATEIINGVTVTGTLDLPTPSNVKSGVTYDHGDQTGLYTASERYTDPGQANVRAGTAYLHNNVNKNGTCEVPVAADVRFGSGVDNTVGTLTVPAEQYVRAGVTYDGGRVGTEVRALKATTKVGVAADDGTGEYDGSERYTDLAESKVENGQGYRYNSLTQNRLGTLDSVTNVIQEAKIYAPRQAAVLMRSDL